MPRRKLEQHSRVLRGPTPSSRTSTLIWNVDHGGNPSLSFQSWSVFSASFFLHISLPPKKDRFWLFPCRFESISSSRARLCLFMEMDIAYDLVRKSNIHKLPKAVDTVCKLYHFSRPAKRSIYLGVETHKKLWITKTASKLRKHNVKSTKRLWDISLNNNNTFPSHAHNHNKADQQ